MFGHWGSALPGLLLQFKTLPVIISALLPAGLYFAGRSGVAGSIWLLVCFLGMISGYSETQHRSQRKTASASGIMVPSKVNSWTVQSLVRTTGWTALRHKGQWQAPAILVRLKILESPENNEEPPKQGQGILLVGEGRAPLPGELLATVQKITIPRRGDLPGMFDYRLFLAGRGIWWRGKIVAHLDPRREIPVATAFRVILEPIRSNILNSIKTVLPPFESSLAGAVLLGAKDKTSRAAGRPFSDLGLAHLFAVSGLHVGVLLGLFLLPGKMVGISAWQKWVFLWLILPPYALLTGLPGSVIRAAGLALLATSGFPFGRQGRPLHFLGLLFWATTIWQPNQALDTGVRLSYAAAGGILAFTSLSTNISYPRRGVAGFVLGGLFISFSAQWFTLPLAASAFGRLSVLSPLANLLAVPTFGLAVWLIVLALAGLLVPGGIIGHFLGALAWLLLRGLAGIVGGAGIMTGGWNLGLPDPNPLIIAAWMGGTFTSLVALRQTSLGRLRRRFSLGWIILVGIIGIGLFTRPELLTKGITGPEVWQFDVGQGDGSLVRFPDGWTAMIDNGGRFGFAGNDLSGPWSRSILPWLRRHNLANPEMVILSHGHLDHTGGSGIMLEECQVGQWLVAGVAHKCLLSDSARTTIGFPVQGEVLHRWQDWTLVIRYPLQKLPGEFHENDFSIVVALQKAGRTQYLWSGDLEQGGESLLLQNGGPGGKTRVWKAGHHGSNTSGSQPFLDVIDPELILISCGVGNGYRHPSHGFYVVDDDTIPVVRTDLEGSIHLKFGQNGEIHWKSQDREGHLAPLP